MNSARLSQILSDADSKIKDAKHDEQILLSFYKTLLSDLKVATRTEDRSTVDGIKDLDLLEKFYECLKTYLVLFTDRQLPKISIQNETLHVSCPEQGEQYKDIAEVASHGQIKNCGLHKEEIHLKEMNAKSPEDSISCVDLNQSKTFISDSVYQNLIDDSIGVIGVSEISAASSPESFHENDILATDILDSKFETFRLAINPLKSSKAAAIITALDYLESSNENTIPSTDFIGSIYGNAKPTDDTQRSTINKTLSTTDSTKETSIQSIDFIKLTQGNAIADDETLQSIHEHDLLATNTVNSTLAKDSMANVTLDLDDDNVELNTESLKSTLETNVSANYTLESDFANPKPASHIQECTNENDKQSTENSFKETLLHIPDKALTSTDLSVHNFAGLKTLDQKLNKQQVFLDSLKKSQIVLQNLLSPELKTFVRNIVTKYKLYIIDLEQFKTEVNKSSKTWKLLQTYVEKLNDAFKVLRYCNANTFLLSGCSGNGKSSTGNSILQKASFQIKSASSHSASILTKANSNVDGEIIEIIDGPGIDSSQASNDILKHSSQNLMKALELCDFTFSGIVLVFQYGSRYTKQESLTVKLLKGLLGETVISDCGICVFTHGDMFESDMKTEDNHCSFLEWCKKQEGEIKCLFRECNYRCVLFDNKTKDQNKMKEQVDRFLALREELKSYSRINYEQNNQQRDCFKMEVARPEMRKVIERKVLEIRSGLQGLDLQQNMSVEEKIVELNVLLTDLDTFQTTIPTLGDSYYNLVTVLSMEIKSKIQLLDLEKDVKMSKSVSEKDNEKKTDTLTNTTLNFKQKLHKLFHIK